MADEQRTILIDLEVDVQGSIESIDTLTKANKELRKERNALNLQSEAGKKRAQEINNLLDQNTDKIKTNVSALEKQKINIGNYKSALDGVHPALGKVGEGLEAGASGFKAMARSALAFIATPIGAILTALVTAFTLLKTAIGANNEILDKFENITNAIGQVVTIVTNRIGKLGEALIALVSGNFSEAIDLTGQAFGGMADEIGRAVSEGQVLLDLSRDLEDAQRQLRIEQAKQENIIKQLVVASKNRNLSFDEQEAKLREALKLEEGLVVIRQKLAAQELEITARKIANDENIQKSAEETYQQFAERLIKNGALGDDQVNSLIEGIEKLESARGSSLAFQEKLENNLTAVQEKRAEALKKLNEELFKQSEIERAARIARLENQLKPDADTNPFETEAKLSKELGKNIQKDLDERQKAYDEYYKKKNDAAIKSAELERIVEEQKLSAAAGVAAGIAGLLDEQSDAYKAFASAQVVISTYAAATKAYEAAFLPIPTVASPALGAAFAAAAILQGLANLAKINGVEFAEGGYTGPGHKYQPAGVVHAGEVVWSQRDVAAVGGPARANSMRPTARGYADGGFVTNQNTSQAQQSLLMLNAIKNIPPGVVSWSEGRAVGNRVIQRENVARIGSKKFRI